MKSIVLSDEVYTQIRILANAWNISNDQTLLRLLDDFRAQAPTTDAPVAESGASSRAPLDSPPTGSPGVVVPVYARYLGTFIEANFHWPSNVIEVTSGPCTGTRFRSPSGAATEIIKTVKPEIVKPNRNGWDFFHERHGVSLRELRSRLVSGQR